jgi:Dolichyl-phosphate-mannose-protein mannosyltransferase
MTAKMFLTLRAKSCMALGACAVLGGGVLLHSSPWGLGLSPDSVVYIGAARSLLAGHGFSLPGESALFSPITHYPPLYSSLLAVIGTLAADPLDGAKWLNGAAFSTNIYVAGFLLFAVLGSWQLALLGSLFTLTAFPLVQAHTMAWSEAMFIMLELLSLLLLLRYLEKPRTRSLLLASAVAGLSLLCRYAGFALVASGILGILFLGAREQREKLIDAGVFTGIAVLPTAVWAARNWYLGDNSFNRTVAFHPIGLEKIFDIPAVLAGWFTFGPLTYDIGVILWLVLLIAGFVLPFGYLRKANFTNLRRTDTLLFLMLIVVVSYLAMMALSLTFLDAQIPVDSRTLSPIYVPAMILLIALSARFLLAPESLSRARVAVSVGLALLLAAQLQSSLNWLRLNHQHGIGYAGRVWRESQTLNRLKRMMPATVLFSNAPDVLYTLLNEHAVLIPRKTHTDTNLPNRHYLEQTAELKRRLKEDRGLLVYLHRVDWRWYLPAVEELERTLGLHVLARENDGVIYQAR